MAHETNGNGEKSRLWAIVQAVSFGLLTWLAVSVVQAKTDIAVLQANYTTISAELGKINGKLDKILLPLRAGDSQ